MYDVHEIQVDRSILFIKNKLMCERSELPFYSE